MLRQTAISKGGFDNMESRRKAYNVILNIKPNIVSKILKINDSNVNFLSDMTSETILETHLKDENKFKYKDIIRLDTLRSKINSIFPKEEYKSTNLALKQKLYSIVNQVISTNNNNYHYCQGFHDITLIFLLIYGLDDAKCIQVTQRFAEFYARESLNNKDNQNKVDFNKEIQVVNELMSIIDPDTYNEIYELFPDGLFFVCSWIVTFFTHNINSIDTQQRIIDYIIVSHPGSIYFLCVAAVYEIYSNFKISLSEIDLNEVEIGFGEVYNFFQKTDYDSLDFDDLILKSENYKSIYFNQNKSLSLSKLINIEGSLIK